MRKYFIVLVMFCAISAHAGDKFGGYIGVGSILISSDAKMKVTNDNKDPEKDANEVKLLVIGELTYKATDSVTLHIGIPQETSEPKLKAGITAKFDESELDVSAVYMPTKAWENPYLDYRNETDEMVSGLVVRYDGIASTPLFAELNYLTHNVDDDLAGDTYNMLKRDGAETEFKFGYGFKKKGLAVDAYVYMNSDERDGDAESSTSHGQGIIFKIPVKSKDLLILGVQSKFAQFDARNPYFDKKREDIELATFGTYIINNVFGQKNKYVSVSGFYLKNVSTIDYFDSTTYGAMLSGGIRF